MRISYRTLCLVLGFLMITAAASNAQPPNHGPASQLVVFSATVDRVNESLSIRGRGFGSGTQVFVEEFSMAVVSATAEQLIVYLPGAIPDGSYLLTVVRGPSPHDRDIFHFALQSPSSLAGVPGPVGPQGEAGPAGPQGETGLTGPAGPAGPQGLTGPDGPQGEPGATGATGPAGPHGLTGPVGPQGLQGDPGAQGPAGPQGQQGEAGAPGAAGAQGPAGLQGPMGPQGPIGPEGPAGTAGIELVPVPMTVPAMGVAGLGTLAGSASCPTGKRVISGSPEVTHSGSGFLLVTSSYPENDTTWRVVLRNPSLNAVGGPSPNFINFKIHLVCGEV